MCVCMYIYTFIYTFFKLWHYRQNSMKLFYVPAVPGSRSTFSFSDCMLHVVKKIALERLICWGYNHPFSLVTYPRLGTR